MSNLKEVAPQNDNMGRMKAAQELSESIRALPSGLVDPQRRMDMLRETVKVMVPTEFQNVNVDSLKKITVDDYIFDASTALCSAKKTREIEFPIRKVDRDLLLELKTNWEGKGFKYTELTEAQRSTQEHFFVSLKW